MSVISTDTKWTGYIRKIKCPRHYLLKPGGTAFVMERIPALKNIKEADAVALNKANPSFKLRLWQPKKDRFGNKILNQKDYYQPDISAAMAKEQIYQPLNPICNKCRRCVTG